MFADVIMNEDCPRYNLRKDFVNVSGAPLLTIGPWLCCARRLLCLLQFPVVALAMPHLSDLPHPPCHTHPTPPKCPLAAASSLSVVVYEQPGTMDALTSLKVPFLQKVRWEEVRWVDRATAFTATAHAAKWAPPDAGLSGALLNIALATLADSMH